MPRMPFQRPKKVEWEALTDHYGRLVAEPFEKGYGLSVGNSLRRALLSVVPGAAVSWVRIDGVRSTDTRIPGVRERTVEVLLNLKKLAIQVPSGEPKTVRLEATGPTTVTGAAVPESDLEIVNPDLHLFTVEAGGTVGMELGIQVGRGYEPADTKVMRDRIGVAGQPVTAELAETLGLKEPRGALVARVFADSPAASAGLVRNDLIIGFDGKSVNDCQQLVRLGVDAEVGRTVKLDVVRGLSPQAIRLTIGDRLPAGALPLDSAYSPITRVSYTVEMSRLGKITDYEKLVLEIWTNGAVGPDDALGRASTFLKSHFTPLAAGVAPEEEETEGVVGDPYLRDALAKPLEELGLPARAINALKGADLQVVADLVQKNEADLEHVKNLGEKSIDEIKSALAALGLSLGMRIDPDVLGALVRGGV